MRALIISYHHNDKNSIGSVRTGSMARLLPAEGIQTYVLTSGAHDGELVFQDNVISIQSNEFEKNFIKILKRKAVNFFKKFVEFDDSITKWESTALKNIDEILRLARPDLIICSYPPFYALRLGLSFSELLDVPLVTDFRDSFLKNPLESGLDKTTSKKYQYYSKLESEIKVRSTLITAASSDIALSFRSNATNGLVKIVYNSFESKLTHCNQDFFDSRFVNVLHTGRISLSERGTSIIGYVKGLFYALKKMPSLADKIRFHFVGSLSLTEKVVLFPFTALRVVKIWGVVDRQVALSMQESADILFVITKPCAENAISGKLIEYIRLNKPILALTSGSEAEVILKRTGLGLIAPPDSPRDICTLILEISKKKPVSENGDIAAINQFEDRVVMKDLANILNNLHVI